MKLNKIMNKKRFSRRLMFFALISVVLFTGCELSPCVPSESGKNETSNDANRFVVSGSGMMRLVVYLRATDRLAAADETETSHPGTNWSALYRLAHPELAQLPTFGAGNGRDNPELLLGLSPQPDTIFKLDTPGLGFDPVQLEKRTHIPVQLIPGSSAEIDSFYRTLRILGEKLGKSERAEEVIRFYEAQIRELERRTRDIPPESRVTCYVGGVSYRGAHGFHSTAPNYEPFRWVGARNVAETLENSELTPQAMMSREQVAAWDPDFVFLDMGTLGLREAGGLEELRTNPLYRNMRAVREGRVFTLLPRASYNTNYDAMLANAWFLGAALYPERFADIDPQRKADEIFTFLLGAPIFDEIGPRAGIAPFEKVSGTE